MCTDAVAPVEGGAAGGEAARLTFAGSLADALRSGGGGGGTVGSGGGGSSSEAARRGVGRNTPGLPQVRTRGVFFYGEICEGVRRLVTLVWHIVITRNLRIMSDAAAPLLCTFTRTVCQRFFQASYLLISSLILLKPCS